MCALVLEASTDDARTRAALEARAHAEERAARLHEEQALAERDAARTGDQVLVADRRLAIRHVEDVDEQFRRHAAEVIDVLRAQIDDWVARVAR